MRLLVTLEEHLGRASDGHIYGSGPADYVAWSELLSTFDEVVLLSRVGKNDDPSAEHNRIDGPSISVHELPDYTGPWEYLRELRSLRIGVQRAIAECDLYLLRVPGLVGRLAWQEIQRIQGSFAAQVLGDPSDAFGSGAIRGVLRPLYRNLATRNLRKICNQAIAVLYCSKGSLPTRYPPGTGSYSAVSPWVILTEGYASSALMAERRRRIDETTPSTSHPPRSLQFGFIGSFAQLYKGADILLRAASLCAQNGLKFRVSFVGEGRYRSAMQSLSSDLSLDGEVDFVGQLNFGKPIFDFLDSVDLFFMPSRAEAFGRALLEAMARGCPCIGSDVGGIPELLDAEDLVPPNDPEALARKIMEVTADPERMKAMSERNLARARQFDPEALRDVRREFYRYVRLHSQDSRSTFRPAK